MGIKKLFFLLLFAHSAYSLCYFIPPKNFNTADPKTLSKEVLIGFIGKSSSLKPSINLAFEKTGASLKEYAKALKDDYKDDKKCFLREIGEVETKAGKALLFEISKKTPFADIRLMQSVLIKDGSAYVITSCCSKEDFAKYYKDFLKSFSSLTFTDDLFNEIENIDEKKALEKAFLELKKDKNYKVFEKQVLSKFDNLGTYWKILLLKKAYEAIH